MLRVTSLRSPRALLLGLLLGCAAGCLSSPQRPTDEVPPALSGEIDDAADLTAAPEGLFMLQDTDLRGPGWPVQFRRYSVFICNPTLSAADVAKIRLDVPGARALAYVNLQDLELDQYPESAYWNAFAAAYDTSWCLRDRPTGRVLRLHGYDGTPGSGLMAQIPHFRNITMLVNFHRDVTMASGFDGLYLDQSNLSYPNWRRVRLQSQSTSIDCDGDGVVDSITQIAQKWSSGRALITARLRQELGDSRLLVANSGGLLGDAHLNGITLEGVGVRFTLLQARIYMLNQKQVGRTPFLGAGWVTSQACVAPTQQLAAEVSGVHYGRVPAVFGG